MTIAVFNEHKTLLFNIAYGMLGSIADSEDILQNTWIKWQRTKHSNIKSKKAYLSKIVINLCIDSIRENVVKRENYIGSWLPEPYYENESINDQNRQVEINNELSIAMLFVLEKLNSKERAVFILKEAFSFRHIEIANTLEISIQNSRQLLSRAKKTLKNYRSYSSLKIVEKTQKLTELMAAINSNNLNDVKNILTSDAVAFTDGGGIVTATLIPLQGIDRIIQVFSHLISKQHLNQKVELLKINGEMGLAVFDKEVIHSIISFRFIDDKIQQIFVQRNPLKLMLSDLGNHND